MEISKEDTEHLQSDIRQETEKWLGKIREKRKSVTILDSSKKSLVENIDAYISDTQHFLGRKDYIRAFEAVIWAWSWIEILEELNVIKTQK